LTSLWTRRALTGQSWIRPRPIGSIELRACLGEEELPVLAAIWKGAVQATLLLDVNERNRQALAFYEAHGFVITGRSDTDADGRPFPLLHLAHITPSR